MKRKIIVSFILIIVVAALVFMAVRHYDDLKKKFQPVPRPLVLYGNVDDRQVNLSFMVPERIETLQVEEGDKVKQGDLLGQLETVRIENRIAEADAGVQSAQAAYDKAVNGYRKEEIAMAEAGVHMIEVQISAAKNLYTRNKDLATTNAVSKQDAENAEAAYNKLLAEFEIAKNNLEKMRSGSRAEDIAAAHARLAQAGAMLAIQKQNLADTKLFAPCDGIIRSRILEPGEISSPQTTALVLAILSPKWVRVYLSEPLLPRVKSGDKTIITIDGLPETQLEGWVGFISPSAEFTPKNVETTELRTSLVYEVRVYVKDDDNLLKLGAPATVTFPEVFVTP